MEENRLIKSDAIIILAMTILAALAPRVVHAQVNVVEQPEVKELMDRFVKLGKEEPYIDGWRIKIISTTNRRDLDIARSKFVNYYPDINFVVSHESPHYSIKVGAFETRIDVEPVLNQFKSIFPTALPYRDKIMKSELFIANGL